MEPETLLFHTLSGSTCDDGLGLLKVTTELTAKCSYERRRAEGQSTAHTLGTPVLPQPGHRVNHLGEM